MPHDLVWLSLCARNHKARRPWIKEKLVRVQGCPELACNSKGEGNCSYSITQCLINSARKEDCRGRVACRLVPVMPVPSELRLRDSSAGQTVLRLRAILLP